MIKRRNIGTDYEREKEDKLVTQIQNAYIQNYIDHEIVKISWIKRIVFRVKYTLMEKAANNIVHKTNDYISFAKEYIKTVKKIEKKEEDFRDDLLNS